MYNNSTSIQPANQTHFWASFGYNTQELIDYPECEGSRQPQEERMPMSHDFNPVTDMKSNESLDKFIDLCIVDEFVEKRRDGSYVLDVQTIPPVELTHLLEELMSRDNSLREHVLIYMQEKVDTRIENRF